jgi:ferredoxin
MSERVRVVVDREVCFSFGVCVEVLPQVFVHDAEGIPVIQPFDPATVSMDLLREAVDGCPRGALTLVAAHGRSRGSPRPDGG